MHKAHKYFVNDSPYNVLYIQYLNDDCVNGQIPWKQRKFREIIIQSVWDRNDNSTHIPSIGNSILRYRLRLLPEIILDFSIHYRVRLINTNQIRSVFWGLLVAVGGVYYFIDSDNNLTINYFFVALDLLIVSLSVTSALVCKLDKDTIVDEINESPLYLVNENMNADDINVILNISQHPDNTQAKKELLKNLDNGESINIEKNPNGE